MSEQIHAHQVLQLLSETELTEHELKSQAIAHFGEHTLYRTCKRSGFSIDDLLVFFVEKQKVLIHDGKLTLNRRKVCSH